MEYEKIIKAIEEAPLTWIPAIMSKAVAEAKRRKVFVDDESMKRVIERVINKKGV